MVMLGNTEFHQVEKRLGYRLTEDDKAVWNKYHSQKADLSEKESCFHIFDIPPCIIFKGKEARDAILSMFTPEKMVASLGTFQVYEQK